MNSSIQRRWRERFGSVFTEWAEDGRIRHHSFEDTRKTGRIRAAEVECSSAVWRRGTAPFALLRNSRTTDTLRAAAAEEFPIGLAPRSAACVLLRDCGKTRTNEMKKETPVKTAPSKLENAKLEKSRVEKKKPSGLVVSGIAITHPDRIISQTGQITKGELAEYFSGVADFILPHIVRRPLSLLRCPAGIDGQCFFQRNPGRGLGADIRTFDFSHNGKKFQYLYIDDQKGLLEVVQMGAIELHPWGATVDAIDYPDRMIFDLDPAPELPFAAVKLAAQDLRERLLRKGLESVVKCTGGKGLHVTVPLARKNKWPEVKAFAGSVADEMVTAAPQAYVGTMSKAKRSGKIFLDYFRNDYTATAIADYGVRARPGMPVALPLEWKELKNLKSGSEFTMKDVLKRIRKSDPKLPSGVAGQILREA
jgi:bifunctional non-homologous end joining protein LigD